MGFRDDLEFILGSAPTERRTLMFSATVPRPIVRLAKRYQQNAVRVTTTSEREPHGDIEYRAIAVAPNDRENAIINLLRYFEAKNSIVFCGTRAAVNRMTSRFNNRGFSVVALSGELSQNERTHALQALRDGRARVCIATDVAARGLDLPNVELVIHADLPTNAQTMLHRSGRTGRAGRKGVSALIVPHNWRKRVERMFREVNIDATWAKPPSVDDVMSRDDERLLADSTLTSPIEDNEKAIVEKLLAQQSPEQIAAAFVRQYRAGQSAPEDLLDTGPAEERPKRPKRHEAFRESVWFSLTIGRSQNVEARWILPMLCRVGGNHEERNRQDQYRARRDPRGTDRRECRWISQNRRAGNGGRGYDQDHPDGQSTPLRAPGTVGAPRATAPRGPFQPERPKRESRWTGPEKIIQETTECRRNNR